MRLKQIKLSGFKSFVDPTSLDVPGSLVGVVGPNGCGKSNVIDAVRWVLGESKASELRGESMQDVIFNGSADRKPAARASVELVFDNALGRIGGPWAGFNEISVRRVLTRDGQSTYQINHQVVRRKDVHDMFLGTGLGPRAYAIIGQGTISRIIEARPEELRVFLEEAAGVSKYKERRRETENRLADTRENLTRVEDILRELDAQIERLDQQAEVAQQYRQMESDRELRQHTLWLVRRDEAAAEQQRVAQQRTAAQTQLESRVAEQRSTEARLEQLRTVHYEAGDAVHRMQGAFYEASSEVSRLESEIRFVVDQQAELRERIAALGAQAADAQQRVEAAADELARSGETREAALERLARLTESAAEAADGLPQLEDVLRDARAEVDAARARAAETAQQIQVLATRRRAIEEALAALQERRERHRGELDAIGHEPHDELAQATARLEEAEAAEHAAQQR
ncbi:MAG TPA: AAA family ATPase, partial [Burkholderiaceae bacterium]|nr:AAA family ATPase [Burkholderiaceae bacterium]